jgi:hypothetical protein
MLPVATVSSGAGVTDGILNVSTPPVISVYLSMKPRTTAARKKETTTGVRSIT